MENKSNNPIPPIPEKLVLEFLTEYGAIHTNWMPLMN